MPQQNNPNNLTNDIHRTGKLPKENEFRQNLCENHHTNSQSFTDQESQIVVSVICHHDDVDSLFFL